MGHFGSDSYGGASALNITDTARDLYDGFKTMSTALTVATNKAGVDATRDAFFALYKNDIDENIDATLEHSDALASVMATPAFEAMRESTMGDAVESVLATDALTDAMMAVDAADDEMKESTARQSTARAADAATDASDTLNDFIEQTMGGGFAGDSDDDTTDGASIAARLQLANMMRDGQFKTIADLIGRFKIVDAMGKKRCATLTASQIVGVELGATPSRVLASQFAMPDSMFDRKFLDRSLMQFKIAENKHQGAGPMVVLIDKSSSMLEPAMDGATRDDFASAFALALLRICRDGGRDFKLIPYNNTVMEHHIVDIKGGIASVGAIDDILSTRARGGTKFKPALSAAVNGIADDADIVLITDGDDRLRYNGDAADGWDHEIDDVAVERASAAFEKIGTRLFIFAISPDADAPGLRSIAENSGGLQIDNAEAIGDIEMSALFAALRGRPKT